MHWKGLPLPPVERGAACPPWGRPPAPRVLGTWPSLRRSLEGAQKQDRQLVRKIAVNNFLSFLKDKVSQLLNAFSASNFRLPCYSSLLTELLITRSLISVN